MLIMGNVILIEVLSVHLAMSFPPPLQYLLTLNHLAKLQVRGRVTSQIQSTFKVLMSSSSRTTHRARILIYLGQVIK